MRLRDLFGAAVRLLGLWFWTQAAYWGYFALLKVHSASLGNPNIPQAEDIAYAVLYTLLGSFLFAGANGIVWLAYGDAPK